MIVSGRDWSEKRILIYGCKLTEEARQHVQTIIDRITPVDHDAELFDGPEIMNIAVNGDLGAYLQLEALSMELSADGIDIEYEPEQFPALMYRADDHVILVVSSGKLLCTGLTDLNEVSSAIEEMTTGIQAVA